MDLVHKMEATTANRVEGKSLFLAIPAYGCMVKNAFLSSLMDLKAECKRLNIPCQIEIVGNESLITRARNLLAAKFLHHSTCTHMMFIDSDISFQAHDVLSMLEGDMDVLCGAYPKKQYFFDHRSRTSSDDVPLKFMDFNVNKQDTCQATTHRGTTGRVYHQVLDAATGFMMIKRQVLQEMNDAYASELHCNNDVRGYRVDRYVALFDCMIEPTTRRYLSEDYAFCRRWQQLGGKVWMDLACTLGHVGVVSFDAGRSIASL